MHIVHDWEFVEDGTTIKPLSAAFVREDGRELYVIIRNHDHIDQAVRHPWLRQNVVPYLPIMPRHDDIKDWVWNRNHPDWVHVMPANRAALAISSFIRATPDPWLWAWYSAYDHVVMCQGWGKMIDLPNGVPMQTDDIKTLEKIVARRRRVRRISWPSAMDKIKDNEHDARADARWGMAALRHLDTLSPGLISITKG